MTRVMRLPVNNAYNSIYFGKEQKEPVSGRVMDYHDYLKTPHWQHFRQAALRRARYRCQVCNCKGPLEVHHRTYVRRGREKPEDVTVLCGDCHGIFHEKRKLAKTGGASLALLALVRRQDGAP